MLTYDEFKELNTLGKEIEHDDFLRLEKKAVMLLHVVTRQYYLTHDFDSDIEMRKKAVKNALASQIIYFIETGKTTSYGINNAPTSVSLGRTSISSGTRYGSTKQDDKALLCDEFYWNLQGTGLLYRGVSR